MSTAVSTSWSADAMDVPPRARASLRRTRASRKEEEAEENGEDAVEMTGGADRDDTAAGAAEVGSTGKPDILVGFLIRRRG